MPDHSQKVTLVFQRNLGYSAVMETTTNHFNQNLFLVGPMGVGKTTIGRLLAEELNLEFIDSDHEIERRAGTNILGSLMSRGRMAFEPGSRMSLMN